MSRISNYARSQKSNLYETCYEYIHDNFHKFKEDNKIKISIDMIRLFNKDGSKNKENIPLVLIVKQIKDQEQIDRFKMGNERVFVASENIEIPDNFMSENQ